MTPCNVREKVATAIEAYLDGKSDNSVLENALSEQDVRTDITCREIASEMSFFLSDFCYHHNAGEYGIDAEVEEAIRRWVYLLRTGWEWSPRRKDTTRFGLRGVFDLLRSNLVTRSRLAGNWYWPLAGPEEWTDWQRSADR